ncbi:MAG: cation:proton antiporter, partial [Acidimicrobiia bacterium]|nr:cation:proton antiporter [Acidimicrobiia bacterium]
MHNELILVVAGVLAGGVIAQWLGWRLRVPAIVFLLAGGLIAGPVTGALNPDDTFGELLFPSVSLAVAVILFEGALGLGWKGVRSAGNTVWLLLTVGAAITLAGTGVAARYILDIDWDLAVLLAAVLVVTGPTVIGPIVRSIGLHGRLGALLESEGTLIDPIGAILTVLVFEAAFATHGGAADIATAIFPTFGAGAVIGLTGAVLLIVAFRRFLVPDQLHNVTTLATVIVCFAAANELRDEAGLVAVTVMGIALASQTHVPVRHVLEFNETLRIVFISGLFVLLGARIEADTLREFEWRNIAFLVALVVIVRPLSIWLSTMRSGLARNERVFLALTAPRGIVAASIASVFSLQLADLGVENSQILVSATFTVIAGTVLLSGFGSRPLAVRLGLVEPGRDIIIVLGANPVARAIATALGTQGAPVRLVDLDRRELAAARMTGLLAHRGSVFADETWDQVGLHNAACFIAVTPSDELNTIAARHAAAALGRKQVFQIPPGRPEHRTWWDLPTGTFARPLFSRDLTYTELADRLNDNSRVTATRLTERFGVHDYDRTHPDALVLFTVNPRGGIEIA